MIKCLKVEPLDDYKLKCTLSDGRVVEFEVSDVNDFDTEITKPLRDIVFFKKVFLEAGTPTWPNGYDICPDYIAQNGTVVGKSKASA